MCIFDEIIVDDGNSSIDTECPW